MNFYKSSHIKVENSFLLSGQIIQTIRGAVSAEQGVRITDIFYTKLFANHPELKNIFNRANQALSEQAKALRSRFYLCELYSAMVLSDNDGKAYCV